MNGGDTWDNATVLAGTSGSVDWDTTDATESDSDPRYVSSAESVWFKLVLPGGGPWIYKFDTIGSRYVLDDPDPAWAALQVLSGTTLRGMQIAAFDQGTNASVSSGSFGNRTLYICVGGVYGRVRAGKLSYSYVAYLKASFSTPFGEDTSSAQAVFVPSTVRTGPLNGRPRTPGVAFGPNGRAKPGESHPYLI